jgi:hypothetical protein
VRSWKVEVTRASPQVKAAVALRAIVVMIGPPF